MNADRKTTTFLWFFVFFVQLSIAQPIRSLEVTILNDGRKLDKKTVTLQMMTHEIISIEYLGKFNNQTDSTNTFTLIKEWRFPKPDIVEEWEDKSIELAPGERGTIRNVVYIRPLETGIDSFKVWYTVGQRGGPDYQWSGNWFMLLIDVIPCQYPVPELIGEPKFTRGTHNDVYWKPAEGSQIHDVFYWEKNDRENLLKAVQGLYKTGDDNVRMTRIQNLEDGTEYGYVVRSVFPKTTRSDFIYSDVQYSIQDNSPPGSVNTINARLTGQEIRLSWFPSEDAVSGVEFYRIYRGVNADREELAADSVFSGTGENGNYPLTWVDQTVQPGYSYYYRIGAVDRVGNEGTGIWSNRINVGSDGIQPPEEDIAWEDSVSTAPHNLDLYIRGSVDTLWLNLDRREEWLRFEAAREDSGFLDRPPHVGTRYFSSGWISPAELRNLGNHAPGNPDLVYYIFDYSNDIVQVDYNFVNNHTYYRRATKIYPADDTVWVDLGRRIPDCYPPPDIHNLSLEPIIVDPEEPNAWYMELRWEPTEDGESGLRQYHIYRKIQSLDNQFIRLTVPDNFIGTVWRDSLRDVSPGFNNLVATYKVLSEDWVGNQRTLFETEWAVQDQALGGPTIRFGDTDPDNVYPADPSSADTLFTRKETVRILFDHFDLSNVNNWLVSVNGKEAFYRHNTGQSYLDIPLDAAEVSRVRVRSFYSGKRMSVWSNTKTVIRSLNLPVSVLSAWNNSDLWDGDIFLQWEAASLDIRDYEVWRCVGTECRLVNVIEAPVQGPVRWTDKYGIDEITGQPGDTLTAYQVYQYKIRSISVLGDTSPFSKTAETYCNRPPLLVSSDNPEIEDGRFSLTVHWKRVKPNLVEDGYTTAVQVFEDNLSQVAGSAVVVDDTMFTFQGARGGHNYIFRIRETPNQYTARPSAWSKPFTVSSLVSLTPFEIIPQPGGDIFVYWNSPDLIEKFKVDSFVVCRNDVCWRVGPQVVSFMDSLKNLEHGLTVEYNVFAIDSLDQVVAANAGTVICDTGSVYIPEIIDFSRKYFNASGVEVSWNWRDFNGRVTESARGAALGYLQSSLSRTFPGDYSQTRSLGPFAVDSTVTGKTIGMPNLLNQENNRVYFRVRTMDAFGHPSVPLWSTDFYPVKKLIFDNIAPRAVSDLKVAYSEAYFGGSDTLVVNIQWSDTSVRHLNPLVANVDYYDVIRYQSGQEITVGRVRAEIGENAYSFSDTVVNRSYQWWLASVDSAENKTLSNWTHTSYYLQTPAAPVPTGFRSCEWAESDVENVEYFVEIAMNPTHFRLAYEMNAKQIENRLICQSGWIDTTAFGCTTGWGNIVTEETWFRIKIRKRVGNTVWESAWSSLSSFRDGNAVRSEQDRQGNMPVSLVIHENYPNPFNAQTIIAYELPAAGRAQIRIFNIKGSLVRSMSVDHPASGYYQAVWDGIDMSGSHVSSGIYIGHIVIETDGGSVLRKHFKMMLIK